MKFINILAGVLALILALTAPPALVGSLLAGAAGAGCAGCSGGARGPGARGARF